MNLTVDTSTRCITLAGRLDTLTAGQLDTALLTLTDKEGDVLLDMTNCLYLSSAGIRIILKARKQLHSGQHLLLLAGVQPGVMHVLEMAGLQSVLHFENDMSSAMKTMQKKQKYSAEEFDFQTGEHQWSGIFHASAPPSAFLYPGEDTAGMDELGLAMGFAFFSETGNDTRNHPDFFVSCRTVSGFIPLSPPAEPDFRINADSRRSALTLSGALSFTASNPIALTLNKEQSASFKEISEASGVCMSHLFQGKTLWLTVAAGNTAEGPVVAFFLPPHEVRRSLADHPDAVRFSETLENFTGAGSGLNITFLLDEASSGSGSVSFDEMVSRSLTLENIRGVVMLSPEIEFKSPRSWIFPAGEIIPVEKNRLAINLLNGEEMNHEHAFLTRLLYEDSSRLDIEPLHGGYSSRTFQVTSFDHDGRKMRPTVMKISGRDLIRRESERCARYALPYIFNNSAVVLGAEFYGNTGALRYNFVGIGGESTRLRWLTHYYLEHDTGFLEPLFDKIFQHILKPWYGQPVGKAIFPYRDHDPTFTFFPHIFRTAEELFGIGTDDMHITVPFYTKPLLNPYRFLRYEYENRRDQSTEYPTGICHGDLNMQNILLDESMNVYLIDFSETRPRSVVSDFARLEAIFMVDNAPVDSEEDLNDYIRFIIPFYSSRSLKELPEGLYRGKHGKTVAKNTFLTRKMRQYALKSVSGNSDIVPYCLALLEWILPIVCYTSLPLNRKKVAMIVSSALCAGLQETDPGGEKG